MRGFGFKRNRNIKETMIQSTNSLVEGGRIKWSKCKIVWSNLKREGQKDKRKG